MVCALLDRSAQHQQHLRAGTVQLLTNVQARTAILWKGNYAYLLQEMVFSNRCSWLHTQRHAFCLEHSEVAAQPLYQVFWRPH